MAILVIPECTVIPWETFVLLKFVFLNLLLESIFASKAEFPKFYIEILPILLI